MRSIPNGKNMQNPPRFFQLGHVCLTIKCDSVTFWWALTWWIKLCQLENICFLFWHAHQLQHQEYLRVRTIKPNMESWTPMRDRMDDNDKGVDRGVSQTFELPVTETCRCVSFWTLCAPIAVFLFHLHVIPPKKNIEVKGFLRNWCQSESYTESHRFLFGHKKRGLVLGDR